MNLALSDCVFDAGRRIQFTTPRSAFYPADQLPSVRLDRKVAQVRDQQSVSSVERVVRVGLAGKLIPFRNAEGGLVPVRESFSGNTTASGKIAPSPNFPPE